MKSRFLSRTLALVLACLFVLTSSPLSALAVPESDPTLEAEEAPAISPLAEGDEELPIYLDTSYTFEERAADLVSRMTLAEKQAQLGNNNPAIPRLGVKGYNYWNEGLHGVARSGSATSFPTSLGISASWDPDLIRRTTDVTSTEARAMYNDRGKGLTYWSPTINLSRDPRWGRADESMGEDPYLTAVLGSAFVSGMQGYDYFTPVENEQYVKAIATIKHYAANNSEFNRHNGNSALTETEIREYYNYAFKEIVQNTNVQSLMTAYNRVNDVPMPANTYMVDTLLRRTYGFTGFITGDCGAIEDIWRPDQHYWFPEDWDPENGDLGAPGATAYALKAGTDMDCGSTYPQNALNALEQDLLSEDDMDVALVRIFTARMMTGEFDPDGTEWDDFTGDQDSINRVICTDPDCTAETCTLAHTALAEEAADDSIVLLQNNGLLPLNTGELDSVALVGPLAEELILGDYSVADDDARHTTTPLEAMEAYLADTDVDFRYIPATVEGDRVSNYIMNLRALVLYRGDQREEYHVADSAEQAGCRLENDDGNVGFADVNGAYVRWEGIDLDGVTKVAFVVSGNDGQSLDTQMELRVGSPSGPILSQISPLPHTSGWSDYQEVVADGYDQGGASGDVYVCFREVVRIGVSDEELAYIEQADAVVVYAGTSTDDSSEGRDRSSLNLPRGQGGLIEQIAKLNPNTVAYMQTVSQVNVENFREDAAAILWCCYNGQAQGNAMVRTLFGKSNPSGKLPITWYADQYQLPDIGDYSLYATDGSNGRTYQYFTGDVTYPFGHGLSYSEFTYSDLKLSASSVTPDDTLTVSFTVENTGDTDGREVAQVYIASPDAETNPYRPAMRLKGFDKVSVPAGGNVIVTIDIPMSDLYFWDEDGMVQTFDQGQYTVLVGPSSGETPLESTFTLTGGLTRRLDLVTATPTGHMLDVQTQDSAVETKLTAVYNDETFVDLESATVAYTSSNPAVAVVDENGVVTPVASGAATITATVTVGGVSASDSFPVSVQDSSHLVTAIAVDDRPLSGFTPEQRSYVSWVEDFDGAVPQVTAYGPENVVLTVTQANFSDASPAATIQAVAGNRTQTYTVRFVEMRDDIVFGDMDEAALFESWYIYDEEDPDTWTLDNQGLTIMSQWGDLYSGQNSVKNLFATDVLDADWTVETAISFGTVPHQNYQQGALVVMDDMDNYVKVDLENNGSRPVIQSGLESRGNWQAKEQVDVIGATAPLDIRLRLEKRGDDYRAYYALDGDEDFTQIGETMTMSLDNPKVGLVAANGQQDSAASIPVTFEYVRFLYDAEESAPLLSVTAPEFEPVLAGYDRPEAQALTLENTGQADAHISSVKTGTDSFTITSGNFTVATGETDESWTIQPKAGLPAATYSDTVTVTCGWGLTTEATVEFVVETTEYKVYFNTGGGTPIDALTVEAGGKVPRPADPTKDGYIFDGWYKDSACTQPWDFEADIVTGTTTLYAGWTPIPVAERYTVTFDSRGGSAVASQDIEAGGKVQRPTNPTRDGYTFAGWFKDTACTDPWSFETDTVSGNLTLYAGWTAIPVAERYTVTFDSRGGSPVASQDIEAGGLVNRPANPTRSNYRFTGWFKDAACTQAWDFAVDTVTGDITLYAGWDRTSTSTPNPAPKPDPEPEPEPGKTTETETRDDGTVITTETNTETGDQTVTIESPDGTVTAVDKPKDGDITAEITVPDGVDETVAPIPLDDLDGGTVAVIVHPDGTEEIIKGSVGADGTLYVPVDGDVTIKIVDNRKDFDDSAEARWAADAIAFVTARELFLGTSDTTFSPNLPMTRGMLATVLWRLEGEPEAGENPFNDVGSDAYYAEAVAWAAETGVVAGVGENTFAPGDDISREQLAVMLYRYAGEPDTAGGLTGYTDGDSVSSWAEAAMAWAVEQGIITGRTTTTLEPLGEATRAEVATMLQRYVLYLTTI